ncbi:MAG: hypothetical protein ACFHX7_09335 [Pseudomonadota bacterium]
MLFRLPLMTCFLLVISLHSQGATDGRAGINSNARFSISLTIDPSIEIITASDISISIRDRSRDASFTRQFCVTGTAAGKYRVIASGRADPESNRFLLVNRENDTLPFDVSFHGTAESERLDPLYPDVPSPVYDVQNRETGCDGTTYFNVTFRREDLAAASSGLYSGSLTLLVSPV